MGLVDRAGASGSFSDAFDKVRYPPLAAVGGIRFQPGPPPGQAAGSPTNLPYSTVLPRVSPTRAASAAPMNMSRSPSSTPWVSEVSTLVRRSLTI